MTTLEVLVAARALIEKPEHWCQGIAYQFYPDENRTEYSLQWAIYHIHSKDRAGAAVHRILERLRHHAGEPLFEFNDTHTHAEVIGLLDTAIAELQG